MNITREKIISSACGVALTTGLIVILVIITGTLTDYVPPSINVPYLIFILSMLAVAPLLVWRLYRLGDIKKILGWTFIGTGAEFIVLPMSLLIAVKSIGSPGALFVTIMIVTYSVVFAVPAGLISMTIGMFLIKRCTRDVSVQNHPMFRGGDE